ncbi:hypothetical protein AAMO2058_000489900 [Amorphochlora amoebiformis]
MHNFSSIPSGSTDITPSGHQTSHYTVYAPGGGMRPQPGPSTPRTNEPYFAFPQPNQVDHLLRLAQSSANDIIALLPLWPAAPWFNKAAQLSVSNPHLLSPGAITPSHQYAPSRPNWEWIGVRLSGRRSKRLTFRRGLEHVSAYTIAPTANMLGPGRPFGPSPKTLKYLQHFLDIALQAKFYHTVALYAAHLTKKGASQSQLTHDASAAVRHYTATLSATPEDIRLGLRGARTAIAPEYRETTPFLPYMTSSILPSVSLPTTVSSSGIAPTIALFLLFTHARQSDVTGIYRHHATFWVGHLPLDAPSWAQGSSRAAPMLTRLGYIPDYKHRSNHHVYVDV